MNLAAMADDIFIYHSCRLSHQEIGAALTHAFGARSVSDNSWDEFLEWRVMTCDGNVRVGYSDDEEALETVQAFDPEARRWMSSVVGASPSLLVVSFRPGRIELANPVIDVMLETTRGVAYLWSHDRLKAFDGSEFAQPPVDRCRSSE